MGRNHPKRVKDTTEYPSGCGGKRCNHIKKNGTRCKNWAAQGLTKCTFHGSGYIGSKVRERKYKFKAQKLTDLFEQMASDPDRLDLTEELGLLRTCLASATERTEKLNGSNIASIICLASDIARTAATLSRIEKDMESSITIEQIQVIADQFISVVARHVKDSKTLEKIQEELFNVRIPNAHGRFDVTCVQGSEQQLIEASRKS